MLLKTTMVLLIACALILPTAAADEPGDEPDAPEEPTSGPVPCADIVPHPPFVVLREC